MSIKLVFVVFQAMVYLSGNAGMQEPSDPERIDKFFEFTGNRFPATRVPRVLVVSTQPEAVPAQSMFLASVDARTVSATAAQQEAGQTSGSRQ